MGTEASVESLLRQLAGLLGEHGETAWAESLEKLAAEYGESPELTSRRICSSYGGMGSFNDLVLHGPDGHPLQGENDELSRLRSRLYASCIATISGDRGNPGA
jgi:hypothetical protein